MQEPAGSGVQLSFGSFQADLRSGELLKNGRRIRLQEQPFQVLAILLNRTGQVVTREEFHQVLSKGDPFGDFDHSLNIAINKIREALGDSAENPRFVETLPKRGYRFIAPVAQLSVSGAEQVASQSEPALFEGRRNFLKVAAGGTAALAGGAGARRRRAGAGIQRRRIARLAHMEDRASANCVYRRTADGKHLRRCPR